MKLRQDIHSLDSARGAHAFYLAGAGVLIDTGLPGGARAMLEEIRQISGDENPLRLILLTHHDVDHMGKVGALQAATGAPVLIGGEDIPYLMGEQTRPGVKRVIQAVVRPKPPGCCRALEGETLPEGIEAFFTPGHTPGHHAFLYKDTLFAGDLFNTRGGRLGLMGRVMDADEDITRRSLCRLKEIDFSLACPAHGRPAEHDATFDAFAERECADGHQ